jgi:hypothetical protein
MYPGQLDVEPGLVLVSVSVEPPARSGRSM